jgi:hypothetical protein
VVIVGAGPLDPSSGSGIATFTYQPPKQGVERVVALGFTTGLSGLRGKLKERPLLRFIKMNGHALDEDELGDNQFNAWYVAMTQVGDKSSHYPLSTTDGPDIMLTSKLTGCTFAVGNATPGCQLVSHVQPPKTNADHARQALHEHSVGGMTDGLRSIFEFGTTPDYRASASVIGVRRHITWSYYVQTYHVNGDGNEQISGARVID